MGISFVHKIWNLGKAVSKGEELANVRRWGKIPHELKPLRKIMPVLMHGKKITFGTVQRKYSHSKRAFIPNILYRPLYSRSLDMQIWCCISATALREVDAFGGLDEYILGVSETKLGDDEITLMYKRKIQEAASKTGESKILNLLKEKYGNAYVQKIEENL
jgi:ribosomal protein L28